MTNIDNIHTKIAIGADMKIGLTLYSGCMASGLFSFAELLEVANRVSGKPVFETYWVGEQNSVGTPSELSPAIFRQEMEIQPHYQVSDLDLDAVLLPGMWISSAKELQEAMGSNSVLLDSLRALGPRVEMYAYCSSVCFLAHIGRLNKQKATSTWWLADFYQNTFAGVVWNFNKTFIRGENYITASGVNGHLPIAMHLIEKHCGEKILRDVTKIVLLPRPETVQHPFHKVDILLLNDALMKKIHYWVEQTPAYELTLANLSSLMNIAERTITRRIKSATGESAMNFIRLVKLNQASETLIFSNQSISEISNSLGYLDDRVFRRAFKRVTGYSPVEYRETFKRNPIAMDTKD